MSGTIEGLTRKISGAADLEDVVRSMKALAASSIGQYQKAVHALEEYSTTLELALTACLRRARPGYDTTEAGAQKRRGIGAIVFGSDQGLVGRFNETVVEYAVNTLKALPGPITKVWPLGERIHALLVDTGMPTAGILPVPASVNAIAGLVGQILINVEAARENGDVVSCIYFTTTPNRDRSTSQPESDCCLWISPGRNSLPPLRGQPNCLRKSSREPLRRYAHSFANTYSSCCFKRAPSRLPAKTPAAWLRCSERRRTLTEFWKT
jgi:alternate F1F0 ATPase F1 subunit gamma